LSGEITRIVEENAEMERMIDELKGKNAATIGIHSKVDCCF